MQTLCKEMYSLLPSSIKAARCIACAFAILAISPLCGNTAPGLMSDGSPRITQAVCGW